MPVGERFAALRGERPGGLASRKAGRESFRTPPGNEEIGNAGHGGGCAPHFAVAIGKGLW